MLGTINMTRAFYPLMKARGGGVIINVIGNAAATRDPDYICGVTGNAGLTAFTEALGSGSLRDGIRVNRRQPRPDRDRPAGRACQQAGAGSVRRRRALARTVQVACPADASAKPAEIAAMVAFLASPLSSYTSGAVITLDAGVSSRSGANRQSVLLSGSGVQRCRF